jgi:hypothetical protein
MAAILVVGFSRCGNKLIIWSQIEIRPIYRKRIFILLTIGSQGYDIKPYHRERIY